jgi:hypothetical protein
MTVPTLTQRSFSERFLVAFSLAGEQREFVRPIAEAVEQLLGLGTVFFYEWYEGHLAATDRDLVLKEIYGSRSEVVVMCPSADYGAKGWTLAEWESIRARHMKLREPGDGAADRLLPMRVADGDVPGLLENTIWVDARQRTPGYLADLVLHRVRKFVPDAGRPRVFLAQTQSDLEDESQPVNRLKLKRFLERDCNYAVSPTSDLADLPPADFPPALQAELAQCQAFVQLLSPKVWKPGRYDQLQFTAAADLNLPRFCFRGDLVLEDITDDRHKAFLAGSDAIAGQFEDFKQHVQAKLGEQADAQRPAIRQFQEADRRRREGTDEASAEKNQPLVRVAIRAGSANEMWEPVFDFLFLQQNVLLDELGPNDSFASKHPVEPCHGFLILCDEKAQSEEAFSPRDALAQCRQIQSQLKDASQIPPVGVVFRAPPDPAWSRLLKSTPKCLHRTLGDNLETGLDEFLRQVRDVRRAYP